MLLVLPSCCASRRLQLEPAGGGLGRCEDQSIVVIAVVVAGSVAAAAARHPGPLLLHPGARREGSRERTVSQAGVAYFGVKIVRECEQKEPSLSSHSMLPTRTVELLIFFHV